jgi:radical SAM superfamily enzyme YgiQ (UPF0313 family)
VNRQVANNKLLLIEPPFLRLFRATFSLHRLPLGVGYLAAAARRDSDWTVRLFNGDFSSAGEMPTLATLGGEGYRRYRRNLDDPSAAIWDEVRQVLRRERPGVVGLSVKTQTLAPARLIARIVRKELPDAVLLIGGPHPSMVGDAGLGGGEFDLAVIGEGEQTLPELLAVLRDGEDIAHVAGVAWLDGGQVRRSPPRPLMDNLDALPFPHDGVDETLIDVDRYPPAAFGQVFATRGCPFGCYFCGSRMLWTRRVRYRSPQNVTDELLDLQHRFGLRFVHFDDDTFAVRPAYLQALCDALATRCPSLRWSCEMHVRLVTDETVAAMKRAGCYMVQIGVESGDDEILRGMRKGFTIAQAEQAAEVIRRHGLRLQAFFMVGFPQETPTSFARTVAAMQRIRASRVMFSIFTPYPGSEAWEDLRRAGLLGEVDSADLFHQSPTACYTPHIRPEEFRRLTDRLERRLDRLNIRHRLRELLSPVTLRRVGEAGLAESLRKGWRVLRGR